MRFLIYGAGALGQALGCMLSCAGHAVDLVVRRRFIDPIRQGGLSVTGVLGDFHAAGKLLAVFPRVAMVHREYDFALITTKTYDTAVAVKEIAAIDAQVGTIVSMQNGCGNLEQIVQRFGEKRSLAARVITGFEIADPGKILITVTADAIHVGGSLRGHVPNAAAVLAEQMAGAGHPCIAVEDIHKSLFAKLLYNCALNPLGAILGVHYGALAKKEETRRIMNSVIEETSAVIQALGGSTPWQSVDEYKKVFYGDLIPATQNHRPSMLQDLENGKRTEVDALVGFVAAKARAFGIAATTCAVLADLVKFRETG